MGSKASQKMNSSESSEPPIAVSYNKTQVTSLRSLKRGDHVAWNRPYGIYSHHAIVVEVLSENELKVIHNTKAEDAKFGAKCKILEGEVKVDLSKGDLYLCNYKPGECLEPDEVIERALSLIGEKIYNLFLSNCEHFATLCKTSKSFSKQVKAFGTYTLRGLSIGAVKGACDAIYAGVVWKSRVGVGRVAKALMCNYRGVIRRVSAHGLGGGAKALNILGPIGIDLAVEGIIFGVNTYSAYKGYKEGVINRKQFCAKRADAGCKSGIRFACSSIGGLIGQLAIPVPIFGGFIGGLIGGVIGHFWGKAVGQRRADAVLRK